MAVTFDPTFHGTDVTLSNGNLTATNTAGAVWSSARVTASHTTGKFYCEFHNEVAANYFAHGVCNASFVPGNVNPGDGNSVALLSTGSTVGGGSGGVSINVTSALGDTVQMAVDIGAGLIWWRVNGTGNWNGTFSGSSANPATGVGGITIGVTGALFPVAGMYSTQTTANFGATGYTFAAPAGFLNWDGTTPIAPAVTWDPVSKPSTMTLSNGNLTALSASGAWNSIRGTVSQTTGKYYAEFASPSYANGVMIGVCNSSFVLLGGYLTGDPTNALGAPLAGGESNNAVIQLAVDLTNKLAWARNATDGHNWNETPGADPATGVGGAAITFSGAVFPAASGYAPTTITVNFGATAYAFTPPTGFGNWAGAAPPLPTVTGLSPPSGPAGTSVTVTGTGFTGVTAVAFGATAASSFVFVSDTSLTAVAPAGTGSVNVTVTTPGGTSAPGPQFTYTAGGGMVTWDPAAKGASITLSGGNLTATTNVASMPTSVRGTVSQTTGKYYAEFTVGSNSGNTTIGVANTSSPMVDNSIVGNEPNSAALYNGTTLWNGTQPNAGYPTFSTGAVVQMAVDVGARLIWWRVNGAGNWNAGSGADPAVGVGGWNFPVTGALYPAISINESGTPNSTTANFGATAYAYAAPAGFLNWDGAAAPTPVVTSLSPPSGPAGTNVSVVGSGFTGAIIVDFGSTPATSFMFNSDTSITAVAPAGTGVTNVTVTTPSGTSATGSGNQWTYTSTGSGVAWNPATKGASGVLSADGLTLSSPLTWTSALATLGVSAGKRYAEFTCEFSQDPARTVIGVAAAGMVVTDPSIVGTDAARVSGGLYSSGSLVFSGGVEAPGYPVCRNRNVVSLLLDADVGTLTLAVNGGASQPQHIPFAGPWFPAVTAGAGTLIRANFGASMYTFMPPQGYVNWDGSTPLVPPSAPPIGVRGGLPT